MLGDDLHPGQDAHDAKHHPVPARLHQIEEGSDRKVRAFLLLAQTLGFCRFPNLPACTQHWYTGGMDDMSRHPHLVRIGYKKALELYHVELVKYGRGGEDFPISDSMIEVAIIDLVLRSDGRSK
jgi:hypothetical protein